MVGDGSDTNQVENVNVKKCGFGKELDAATNKCKPNSLTYIPLMSAATAGVLILIGAFLGNYYCKYRRIQIRMAAAPEQNLESNKIFI